MVQAALSNLPAVPDRVLMTDEQQAEYDALRVHADALRKTAARVEDLAAQVRACLDPANGQDFYLETARHKLSAGCAALIRVAMALDAHGEASFGAARPGADRAPAQAPSTSRMDQ